MDMSPPSSQVASLLNKANFPLYQHLSLEYWLSSGKQPDLRSVTETLSFFFFPPLEKQKQCGRSFLSFQPPLAWACPCSCRGPTLTAALCPSLVIPEAERAQRTSSPTRREAAAPWLRGHFQVQLLLSFMARFTRDGPVLTCSALLPLWKSHVFAHHPPPPDMLTRC